MSDDPKQLPYKVICISMYHSDIALLKQRVAELKRRGWTKANKSHLIRLAIAALDLEETERLLTGAGMIPRLIGDRDIKPENAPHDAAE